MEQTPNKYMTVAYELYTKMDGKMELTEQAPAEHPFQFITGMGFTLEAFEKNLINLNAGDKFDFTLSVDDAYGPHMPEGVQELPKSVFEINGKFDSEHIKEGLVIPMMNQQGERFNATVTEITENTVTVDLNHPLAGKELNFKGQVVVSRDATNQEIEDLVKMMTGGCGGNCGGCGGNCGGDEGCNCGGDCDCKK
ncbi:MAG: FKBP-type peptidyl-prolyl cis-trans isomerase [Bacteroidales bacterium]|nr:FKBP-type peptidyl-prolyl cis-trans isomerase [Bacteroidales bacterium]